MPVVERAGREKDEGDQPREGAGDTAREAPGGGKPDQPDGGAHQPPRLEQRERQDFCGERRRHVEPAAVFVKIDEMQRARVDKAGAVERKQQLAVLGVRVIVPAEAVVAERARGE